MTCPAAPTVTPPTAPGQTHPPADFGPLDRHRDLAEVLDIEAVSFSRPWSRAMFIEALDRGPGTHAFVARSPEGHVTAYCLCQIVIDELHIHSLAVKPESRGRGLGGALLAWVLGAAGRLDAAAATLEVRRSNVAAQRLYEGAGFRQSGVRVGYYPDPPEDALVYWLRELGSPDAIPATRARGSHGTS